MSNILYNMIHDRAKADAPHFALQGITAENYKHWEKHWFETAEKIAKEFNNEGLIATHDAVIEIIAQQKKYCK